MPYYSNAERRNYFIEFGSGQPVLLLHGEMSSGRAWAPQIAALTAAGARVIVPDLPGHGASASLDYPLSTDAVVADLLMLLEHCRLTDVSVVGVSLGGLIATHLARAKPNAVSKVIIADAPLRVTPDLRALLARWSATLRAHGPVALLERSWPLLMSDRFRSSNQGLQAYQRWHGEAAHADGVSLANFYDGFLEPHRESEPSPQHPTLLIAGEKDALIPAALIRQMSKEVSDACCVEIKGAGHLSNVESSDRFNKSMVRFITGVSKPGGFKNDPDDPLNPNQAIERHRRTLRPTSHRLNHP